MAATLDDELLAACHGGALPPLALPVTNGRTYRMICHDVYDGDTIRCIFRADNGALVRHSIRLVRIDAPEIRTRNPREKAAARHVRDILEKMVAGKLVEAHFVKMEQWGRMLCDVTLDGRSISDELLARRLVKPYSGKHAREEWTEAELAAIMTPSD
jgi:endonuclease YncB( thermonuclease family)